MHRVSVVRGDITRLDVDAIVNAANKSLLGGGGVDGAIHRAAGPGLKQECASLGGCETGRAKITGGHKLPARYVIHTVGPVWSGGSQGEEKLLASCYRESLRLAVTKHAASVAFPAISCGVFRFPIERAARIAVDAVMSFRSGDESISQVVLCCFDSEIYDAWAAALAARMRRGDT